MKEQYQSEMVKIHVPEALLEKTKLAMKEEEERIRSQEQRKVIPFGKISMAAAAAVVLLVITPVAVDYLNIGSSGQQGQLYLSETEETEMVKIEANKEKSRLAVWFEELLEKIEEFFD